MNPARRLHISLLAASGLLLASVAWAQTAPPAGAGLLNRLTQEVSAEGPRAISTSPGPLRVDHVEVTLLSAQNGVVPGQQARMALRIRHDPHWHTYWQNPGDSGLPTSIEWRLASGPALQASPIAWPAPQRIPVGPLASYGFEGEVLLIQTVDIPADVGAGNLVELIATANWLVCKDVCIPGDAELSIELPLLKSGNETRPSEQWPAFEAQLRRLPMPSDEGQGFAFLPEEKKLLVWGRGDAERRQGGYLFVETEELVWPAAAQALHKTAGGWRLEIPLAESSRRSIEALSKSGRLNAVWVQESESLRWTLKQGVAPASSGLVSPGRTAEEENPAPPNLAIGSVAVAMALAWLGGLILNLMPCVFPVIGLKVLSFSQSSSSAAVARVHALLFTAGVLVAMLALAGLLVGLRAAGEAVGWGFQLQNPWVVAGLALLFSAIAINLLGGFEFGSRLTQLGALDHRSGKAGAFLSGLLAVVVASPCTAPFMGGALGYAATAPVWQAMSVFAFLGLGLATPYLILGSWPAAVARLPKPGPWMEGFKQFLAFPMLATVAWLIWVFNQQQGSNPTLSLLMATVGLGLALWAWGRLQRAPLVGQSSAPSGLARGALLVLIVLGAGCVVWLYPKASATALAQAIASPNPNPTESDTARSPTRLKTQWQAWSPGLPQKLQAQGKVVLVDFTAAWCISCQANKARVLHSAAIDDLLSQANATALVADWTRRDANITAELQRHGRNGVPLYLVYPRSGGAPEVLSEWLTESEVMGALQRAGLK